MKKLIQVHKIGKILAVILFTIIACIIILYFIFRNNKNVPVFSPVSETFDKPKFQEGVVHFEIKGGERRLLVKGRKHYLGEDGKYYLEKNIEIKIFPKRRGQKEVFITAEKGTYNEAKTLFILLSNVVIKQGDFFLSSNEVIFNRIKNVIRAKGEIQFFTDELKGEGKGLVYFIDNKIIKILSDVKGEIKENKYPIIFQCNKLEYSREEKKAFLKGKVFIYQHLNGLKSNQALLELDPSEKKLKSIKLIKKAKVTLVEKDEITNNPIEIREMKANEILISFKNSEINSVHGKENCYLKISSEDSIDKEIKAHEIELFLNSYQSANFKAIGNVFLKEIERKREVMGEIIIKDNKNLTIFGSKKQRASISFENNKLLAQKILINLKNNNIIAKGKIENIISSDPKEENSISFLSSQRDIHITAKEMNYINEENIINFMTDVQLKQGNSLITSEKININNEKKIVLATGKIKAFLYPEKEQGLITIISEQMEANDSKKIIIFRENKSLFLKNLKISAKEIEIFLKEENEGVKSIRANNDIQIKWKEYQASGDIAEYIPEEEKFILSGNVLLQESGKPNKINGTKLTFYLSDDRIMMENKEGRIITILEPKRK